MNNSQVISLLQDIGALVRAQWRTQVAQLPAVAQLTRESLAEKIRQQRRFFKREADAQLATFVSDHRDWRDLSRR